MITRYQDDHLLHWYFFQEIDKDLQSIESYIYFNESHFEVYSIQLASVLFSASSECDSMLRLLYAEFGNEQKEKTYINDYYKIVKKYTPLINTKVRIPKYNLEFKPFLNWTSETMQPLWWRSYNTVKHDRPNGFQNATLKNAINAVGALHILNILYLIKVELGDVFDYEKSIGDNYIKCKTHNENSINVNFSALITSLDEVKMPSTIISGF